MEGERLPMLISAAGPLVLFSMQLGWMREPGFQHTPISINLAMLEAAHRATMPLGQSMPSRLALHIHSHTCLQINCCVELFVTTRALFFCLVEYINH